MNINPENIRTADMEIPTTELHEEKKPKKNPIKKATKAMRKTGKKVVCTTGKVAKTAVGIALAPITIPLAVGYYAGVTTAIAIIHRADELD